MTLEKQPDWIDKCIEEIIMGYAPLQGTIEHCNLIRETIQKHLPQEDTYQKTNVQNVLLYETGYKQGREDMEKEILTSLSESKKFKRIINNSQKWENYISDFIST